MTRVEELLAPLREHILDGRLYISGMLRLPPSYFSLFYKTTKDEHSARHIDLANATFNDLEQLAQACESASVQEGAMNEIYCEVGKMDDERFASLLVADQTSLVKLIGDHLFKGTQPKIKFELRELNVYTQGSFSKHRVETSRKENMFGSLVIVFPTPHQGGAFLIRHRGQQSSFDPGREFTAVRMHTIGYLVLLNDVEYEVMPVTSGHCVTLTYNLYRDVDGSVSAHGSVEDPSDLAAYERAFRESFESLLKNPEFLPYGGTLGFGLQHSYPVEHDIKRVYELLKANDAIVYRSLRALGFQPKLYLYHEWDMRLRWSEDHEEGSLIDYPINFQGRYNEDDEDDECQFVDISRVIREEGGHVVCRNDAYRAVEVGYEKAETVEWVTPVTDFSRWKSSYAIKRKCALRMDAAYFDLCLVVRIGGFGKRLMYPTIAQLKKESERDDRESEFWYR